MGDPVEKLARAFSSNILIKVKRREDEVEVRHEFFYQYSYKSIKESYKVEKGPDW